MKTPKLLEPLIDNGLIDEVLHSLNSGKDAAVQGMRCRAETCCAKVYKQAVHRSFCQNVLYQEGRKVHNSPPCPRHGEGGAVMALRSMNRLGKAWK